jgi:hypothetical protein
MFRPSTGNVRNDWKNRKSRLLIEWSQVSSPARGANDFNQLVGVLGQDLVDQALDFTPAMHPRRTKPLLLSAPLPYGSPGGHCGGTPSSSHRRGTAPRHRGAGGRRASIGRTRIELQYHFPLAEPRANPMGERDVRQNETPVLEIKAHFFPDRRTPLRVRDSE